MAIEGAIAVAELAWWRMDRRSELKGAAAAREKEWTAMEAALVIQREDNRRLRATLEEYNGVLREFQEKPESWEWLGKELSTTEGTADVSQHHIKPTLTAGLQVSWLYLLVRWGTGCIDPVMYAILSSKNCQTPDSQGRH